MSTYTLRFRECVPDGSAGTCVERSVDRDVDRDGPCNSGQEIPSNATVIGCRQTMVGERHGASGWAIAIGVLVTVGLLVIVGLAGAGGRT